MGRTSRILRALPLPGLGRPAFQVRQIVASCWRFTVKNSDLGDWMDRMQAAALGFAKHGGTMTLGSFRDRISPILSSLRALKQPMAAAAPAPLASASPLPIENLWALSRWTAAAYVCIALSLAAVLAMAGWGAYHDLELVRTTLVQSETNRLRTHATRTVAMMESQLRAVQPGDGGLLRLRGSEYTHRLREHWATAIFKDESRDYAAVTDLLGRIIIHSHPEREDKYLGPTWYDRVVDNAGIDVVETSNPALTGGFHCYDVHVPIYIDGGEVGTYHSGLSCVWLDHELSEMQRMIWRRWSAILGFMVCVVLLAGAALYYITRRLTMFREAFKLARVRRFAEVGQLMAGIAHEIRNPLNAMRLNLHVLGLYQQNGAPRDGDGSQQREADWGGIIRETNHEIERVDELIRVLLGYARPDRSNEENLDVAHEIQSTLSFLKPVLEKAEVTLRLHLGGGAVNVHMDRDRFRQIMLNLINNAKEATGAGGTIDITIAAADAGMAEVVVADDGPGVPSANRERIFEPFFTTKELGTGLGLALVKRFVEETGGSVTCQRSLPHGARFVLRLPEVASAPPLPVEKSRV